MNEETVMILSHNSAWYQYPDITGRVRTFFLGHCDSFAGLVDFCRDAGIPLMVFSRRPSSHAKRSAARAATERRGMGNSRWLAV
jgi:hypothetical protein